MKTAWDMNAYQLRVHQAEQVATILLELDPDDDRTLTDERPIASPAGSEQALRGIPVVGARGVGGTIPDTDPLRALLAKERRNVRLAS